MTAQTRLTVDWALRGLVIALLTIIAAGGWRYVDGLNSTLADIRVELTASKDRDHALELMVAETTRDRFTGKDAAALADKTDKVALELVQNTREDGLYRERSARDVTEIKASVIRIEERINSIVKGSTQ